MNINKQIRSGNPETDAYIEELESWIESFEASNIKKLIMACDEVSGIIADDVIKISKSANNDEIDNELQLLGSKKNKIYERFLSLVSQIKHFETVSDALERIKPKRVKAKSTTVTTEKVVEEEIEPVKPVRISDMAKNK